MPPLAPGQGGAQAQAPQGPLAVLRAALNRLQALVEERWERGLRRTGTCGQEFMRFLDELEELADRELLYRGLERVPEERLPLGLRRREGEHALDLVLGYYRVDSVLVEIGLRAVNRCGILEEVAGGEPPRVYARLYLPGGAALVVEAEEARPGLEAAGHYYI